MTTWFESIILAIKLFTIFTVTLSLPFTIIKTVVTRKFNINKFIISNISIIYFMCLFAVVFFPLPTASQNAQLSGHAIQLIPFFAFYDVSVNFSITAVLQIVFNVIMTVPFGMLLGMKLNLNTKKTILATLALSVLIEVAQLTGLFFIYRGSFRLCDVDDLILNTLGGYIGSVVFNKVRNFIPTKDLVINFNKKVLARI